MTPWQLGRLTPREFTLMRDGYILRRQDLEDLLARFVAPICSSGGRGNVSPEQLLGRPFRGQLEHLKDKKKSGVDDRLAQKDRERQARLKDGKPVRGKKAK